jgi:drug/metabolite transporter (DMT)-like permease
MDKGDTDQGHLAARPLDSATTNSTRQLWRCYLSGTSAGHVRVGSWSYVKAGGFALSSIFIFVLIFSSGRFTLDLASAFQIMFLRYAGGFITVVILARVKRQSWSLMQSQNRVLHATRALAGGMAGSAVIFANMSMPLVDANAIGLLNVVFAMILGAAVLGDRLRARQYLGGAACLVGAATIMIVRGAFSGYNTDYLVPSAVAVLGAALLATESIHIKLLTTRDRPLVTLAHANFFGTILMAVPALITWQSPSWLIFALLGLGPFAILGQYFTIRAYSLAPVSVLAPLSYTSLLFVAVLGWVFFSELPTSGVLAGAALITLGGTMIILSRR